MPEPTPAPMQPATGSGNPPAPAGSPAAPANLTQEQVDAAIQKALNPVFATLRRLAEPAPAPGAPAPAAPAGGTPTQENALQARVQAAEAKLAKGDQRLRSAGLREAAQALGVVAERIPVLLAFVEQEHGKAIKLNDADEPVHLDEFGQATPVRDWLANVLKTPAGQMFLPPVKLPNLPKGGGPPLPPGETRTYMDLTLAERLELEKPEHAEKRRSYLAAAGMTA